MRLVLKQYFLNVIILFACYPFQSEKMVAEANGYLL